MTSARLKSRICPDLRAKVDGKRRAPSGSARRRRLAVTLPGQNQLMTKETNMIKPIPETIQKNGEGSASGVASQRQAEAPANLTVLSKQFRRLKPGEVVGRGDFVANDQRGLEPWEGPGGFRAGAFVKPIYRRNTSRSSATKKAK